MSAISVRRALFDDVDAIAPMFDAYRVFYDRAPDLEGSKRFLRSRLAAGESFIFIAEDAGAPVGFVQLYPTFSSTSTPPGLLWVFNDLFVVEHARRRGVARKLMMRAEEFARETGAVGLTLSTEIENLQARDLYLSVGYRRDAQFYVYNRFFNADETEANETSG
jgi:GNAT superfamily N-acetyltransferase